MLSSRLSAGEGINRDVGLAPFKHCMSADCECGYGICMLLYLVLHTLPCVYRNRPAHTKCATTMKKKKSSLKKGTEIEARSCRQFPHSMSAVVFRGSQHPTSCFPSCCCCIVKLKVFSPTDYLSFQGTEGRRLQKWEMAPLCHGALGGCHVCAGGGSCHGVSCARCHLRKNCHSHL